VTGPVASILAIVLGAIACLHAYWGAGGLWPGTSEADLIAKTIGDGRHRMPPRALVLLVSVLIGIAAVWPLLLVMRSVLPLPDGLVTGLGAALGLLFLARGGAGYAPQWRRAHPVEPFARLDRSLYSPLCLLIGAGFAILLLGSPT
jgi:hypothetical protein